MPAAIVALCQISGTTVCQVCQYLPVSCPVDSSLQAVLHCVSQHWQMSCCATVQGIDSFWCYGCDCVGSRTGFRQTPSVSMAASKMASYLPDRTLLCCLLLFAHRVQHLHAEAWLWRRDALQHFEQRLWPGKALTTGVTVLYSFHMHDASVLAMQLRYRVCGPSLWSGGYGKVWQSPVQTQPSCASAAWRQQMAGSMHARPTIGGVWQLRSLHCWK